MGHQIPYAELLNQGSLTSYTPTWREAFTDFMARNWYGDNREGTRQAEYLQNVLENVTPWGFATMGDDAAREMDKGNYTTGGLLGLLAVAPVPPAIKKGLLGEGRQVAKGIRAYHGSPYDFDEFSMNNIGTGEGAQAYGHGLYFAENEGVARGYKNALAPGMGDGALRAAGVSDAELRSMRQFTQSAVDPDVALRDWLSWNKKTETPEIRAAFMQEWNAKNPGSMYEVNIDADPNTFLDWDKPLSEQSQNVRQGVKNLIGSDWDQSVKAYPDLAVDGMPSGWAKQTGQQIHDAIVNRSGFKGNAEAQLKEAGIPGIKYLDAGSRNNSGWKIMGPNETVSGKYVVSQFGGNNATKFDTEAEARAFLSAREAEQSRNYVVFDERLISIIRKYGIAGASVYLGYDLTSNMTPAQAALAAQIEQEGNP